MKEIQRNCGMTLMELVAVVAIIGILGAVAYPSYVGHVQRSNRAAAKAVLEQAAQYMERQYTLTNVYPNSAALAAAGFSTAPLGATASNKRYTISLPTTTATTFTLQATPVATFPDPKCGYLQLDHIGNRASQTGAAAECWGR